MGPSEIDPGIINKSIKMCDFRTLAQENTIKGINIHLKGTKRVQKVPWGAQKMPKRWPKEPQERPKRAQEGPRGAQEGSQWGGKSG